MKRKKKGRLNVQIVDGSFEMKEKTKVGRPRKEIDYISLDKLCSIQCTGEECAGFMDVSYDTLDRHLKEDGHVSFADYFKKKSSGGKISLRRTQWKSAMDGNVTMQIWLGKQMLNQKDNSRQEVTGPEGGDIKFVVKFK